MICMTYKIELLSLHEHLNNNDKDTQHNIN